MMKYLVLTVSMISLFSCGGTSKTKLSKKAKEIRELEFREFIIKDMDELSLVEENSLSYCLY